MPFSPSLNDALFVTANFSIHQGIDFLSVPQQYCFDRFTAVYVVCGVFNIFCRIRLDQVVVGEFPLLIRCQQFWEKFLREAVSLTAADIGDSSIHQLEYVDGRFCG